MGLLELAFELNRQEAVDDSKYLQQSVYFFELRVPESVAKSVNRNFIYPLIIAPESYRMSEPFAVSKSPTNFSGLWVEENGTLWRDLTISGTTGFKPRRGAHGLNGVSGNATVAIPYEGKSYDRSQQFSIVHALSGQRHFQFLQDAVFRTYADLKRDPATADGTELFFHNLRDDERWRVIPMQFDMERSAKSTNLYRYTIQLMCVEGAATSKLALSEDENILKQVKDGIRMVGFGLSLLSSGINDLTNAQNDLRMTFLSFASWFDNVGTIASATKTFLRGTQSLIAVPLAFIESTKFVLDESLAAYNELLILGQAPDVPNSVLNTMRKIGDGLNVIGSYPELFRSSTGREIDEFIRKGDILTVRGQEQLALAEAQPSPNNFREFNQLGSGLLPGDYARARDELGLGRNVPRYTGAAEQIIQRGDTLANLAGRYLGDARKWKFLAIVNDLRPPYISDDGLPGTLTVGDSILIPNFSREQGARGSPVVLGVMAEQPGDEHALGVDLRVEDSGKGQYDLLVDYDGGAIDMKLSRGRDCLAQGIRSRLTTERGFDILYKQLGVHRTVGLGLTVVDKQVAQLRLIEAIQSDPRISAVRSFVFANEPSDTLTAEIDAEVRGFTRSEKIIVRP